MTTRAHGWPHCDCAACIQRRYDEGADAIHSALSHDTPQNLASVAMTGIRPMTPNQRRALLEPVLRRRKEHSGSNLNG